MRGDILDQVCAQIRLDLTEALSDSAIDPETIANTLIAMCRDRLPAAGATVH
jgi:hypothetical protein